MPTIEKLPGRPSGPADAPAPTVRLRGIRKSFGGIEVLHGVDLDVRPGRVVALLGENGAGKSTLVKILSGDYQADAGTVEIGGTEHTALTPISARALGIRMIYQELNDAPTLTVAENICLGKLPATAGFVHWRSVRKTARRILSELEVDLDIDAPMSTLRVGERQVVEIARAMVDQAKVLILDEPTAALSNEEVATLFSFVKRLRDLGTAMVYITHRLDELREVADDVVVLRDGNVVLQGAQRDHTRAQLVEAMVGASIAAVGRPENPSAGTDVLVRLTSAASLPAFTDVSLTLRRGEVLALYGKVGSGIAEVGETIYGLRPLTGGSIDIDGRPQPRGPRQAVNQGLGLLRADRKAHGAFGVLSSARNLTAATWRRDARLAMWANETIEKSAFARWRERLRIRVSPSGAHRPILQLSGGNQQKVLLARWLHANSQVLLLAEPTRGVDVGARQDIYLALRELAADGIAVLMATSDYEEVIQVADRAIVMAAGRVVRELGPDEITVAALTDAAGG